MPYITTIPRCGVNEQWITNEIGYSLIPSKIQHPLIEGEANSIGTRYQASFYSKIAIDIVTETVYNYKYPFISEKTLRPIACKRLFIVVGAPGTLSLLHSKGFQTFPDVIDESYDLINDPIKRWRALECTIGNFLSLPLDKIKDILRDKTEILDQNFKTLQQLMDAEIRELNV